MSERSGQEAPLPSPAAATTLVFFTTLSLLMYQILQTVTLSLQLFHSNAFLAISMCMFGLGGGGSLAFLFEHRGHLVTQRTLWSVSLAYAVSLVAAAMLSSRTHSLPGLILTGFLPYLLAGVLLPMIFRTWPERAGRIYFVDLLGSGLGALLLVPVLDGLGDAGKVQLATAGIALLGTLACALLLPARALLATACTAVLVLGLLPWSDALFPYQAGPEKRLGFIAHTQPEVQSRVEWSKWSYLGRLDALIPSPGFPEFGYGGDWVRPGPDSRSDTRLLFASGDNWAATVDFKDDEAYRARFLRQSVPAAPYLFLERPDVLNIGLGGGVDAFLALQNGAKSVVGVEINPLMIEAALERYADFFDGTFRDERFSVHEMDGRTFANQSDRRFDLITLTAVDTGAGLGAGGYVLSENYLYTREAFDTYLALLEPGGLLFVYRPVLGARRILATLSASLRARGAKDPEQHLAVLGGPSVWTGVLAGVDPLPESGLDALAATLARGELGGRQHYLPGMALDQPGPFSLILSAIAGDREREVLQRLPRDFSPVTDDRPFFYQHNRSFFGSEAGQRLTTVLAVVSAGALLLIVLPLLAIRGRVQLRTEIATLGYFACIGLGFMLVEVALIQKLVLYLGHPTYSLMVTLFVLLVFSGLGSLCIGRFERVSPRAIASLVPAVLAALLFYAFGLDPLLESSNLSSLTARATLTAASLAPGSFFMGMLLPSMIRLLGDRDRLLISWAWGVNALASVIASIVAVMISMTWGFTWTILAGALCYAGAGVSSLASQLGAPRSP